MATIFQKLWSEKSPFPNCLAIPGHDEELITLTAGTFPPEWMVMEIRAFDAQDDNIGEIIVLQSEAFELLGAFEECVCLCFLKFNSGIKIKCLITLSFLGGNGFPLLLVSL